MLSYKTTTVIAKNKETQEEVARYFVTGDGLFTVAERACTAETCGNSEGKETPVRRRKPDNSHCVLFSIVMVIVIVIFVVTFTVISIIVFLLFLLFTKYLFYYNNTN